jgi:hypothetical protein
VEFEQAFPRTQGREVKSLRKAIVNRCDDFERLLFSFCADMELSEARCDRQFPKWRPLLPRHFQRL